MLTLSGISTDDKVRGIMLLQCTAALGLVGIAVIVGLSVARARHWQRLQRGAARKTERPLDPWAEAGRRMRVPPEESAKDGLGNGPTENQPEKPGHGPVTPH